MLAPPDTVLLEVGGSRRLRGGIEPLLDSLRKDLVDQGLHTRIGLAPVAAAACLLARLDRCISQPEALVRQLAELALDDLVLPSGQAATLSGCGLRTVGDLMRLPAADRARRFGPGLNRYLDQLHGRIDHTAGQLASRRTLLGLHLELPVATASTEALMLRFSIVRWITCGRWRRSARPGSDPAVCPADP